MLSILLVLAVGVTDSVYVGRVDTIGGTTYDWQLDGSALRRLVNSPQYGLYAVWLFSSGGSPFPDRNMRYNFYDFPTRAWTFIDPNYMQSGQSIFAERAGFGNLDVNPSSGECFASAHYANPLRPVVSNLTTGEFCVGPEGYVWPVLGVGANGYVQVAMMDDASRDRLCHSRISTWCHWDSVVDLGLPQYPSYNLAASKVSDRVAVFWVDLGSEPVRRAYYRVSTDAGETWGDVVEMEPPPAYAGDTLPSFSLWGLFPFYDWSDRLHIVASVHPVVRDTAYILPAEIWHWCESNMPRWSRVHRAGCEPGNLQASVGYGAVYCDRPSIGEDRHGNLFMCWEQFDSANVEPVTQLLRAGIWLSASEDNGQTWQPGEKITPENSVSHRFPCIVDRMVNGGALPDTTAVLYMMDLQAGFYVQGQGDMTSNPVVCQFVEQQVSHVAEQGRDRVRVLSVWPNPARRRMALSGADEALLCDAAGRVVAVLGRGWNDLGRVTAGVYFVRPSGTTGARKLVVRH
jgi:hypothetical protein